MRLRPAPATAKAKDANDELLDSAGLEGKREAAGPTVTVVSATFVSAPDALVKALTASLASSGCPELRQANTLRLSIDAAGRVRVLSVRGASADEERCLRRRLAQVTSATVASGKQSAGTVEVRITP